MPHAVLGMREVGQKTPSASGTLMVTRYTCAQIVGRCGSHHP